MLAWEWTLDKAREEEESEKKKAVSRKISQTAQVLKCTIMLYIYMYVSINIYLYIMGVFFQGSYGHG